VRNKWWWCYCIGGVAVILVTKVYDSNNGGW
jgi:hypothetical protein